MKRRYSRYSLAHRFERWLEADYRQLISQHRQSLAYKEIRSIKVDCSFLPQSRWGVLGEDPALPAWVLYMDMQVSQPEDCSLASATVEVSFQGRKTENREDVRGAGLGPVVSKHFGPRKIDGQVLEIYSDKLAGKVSLNEIRRGIATYPSDSQSYTHDHRWSLQGSSWPAHGDSTGLSRRVEWLIKNAVSLEGLRLGLALQHEMEPFTIKVHLNGRLKGTSHRWFSIHHLVNRENAVPVMVIPSCENQLKLDDIAAGLDEEMTIANINNYARTTHTSRGSEYPGSDRENITRHPTSQSNIHGIVNNHPATHPKTQKSTEDYTIAWICALPVEMAAAKAMLDEVQKDSAIHLKHTKQYILGRSGLHNIVMACLPQSTHGTNSAAIVAAQILHEFKCIRLFLLVGIGGGVPSETTDIRLGDVVVSCPTKQYGGILQHDFGRFTGTGFEKTGVLNKPPSIALLSIARLRAHHLCLEESQISCYVDSMIKRNPGMSTRFAYPSQETDELFMSDYDHESSGMSCEDCDQTRVINRPPRDTDAPTIHYGLIASGNQLIRHGTVRDKMAKEHGILCFEMEAAGLMDNFPCLVIRGISDYADSHKNDLWQGYAAATAAAYAKELLLFIPVV